MSRFAHEHPDDPEGAMERLIDRADHDRKAARENGDPQPRAYIAPDFTDLIFDTVRIATKASYPEARIPETPMPDREQQIEALLAELPGDLDHLPQRSQADWLGRIAASIAHANYLLAMILVELRDNRDVKP